MELRRCALRSQQASRSKVVHPFVGRRLSAVDLESTVSGAPNVVTTNDEGRR